MITSKQRRYLKSLGQNLDPIVYIGKADLTDNVINEMDSLLESRELIKVKLQEASSLNAKDAANEAADMLDAEFVQAIGRRFVLYRQSSDKDKRKIVLPRG